jgi:hypothetical protein
MPPEAEILQVYAKIVECRLPPASQQPHINYKFTEKVRRLRSVTMATVTFSPNLAPMSGLLPVLLT